ncbi:entericidin A/B family lipoprotein [Budviciaceae bacterium BWR-B9]|uniref:Entericidin A/B family lipoprotein n=1 Tax=Limnobaculum allomyrinae TaxID=2791986 RepID=A0ABS1IVB6_9GAMM|nr:MULTISPECIES: entericidin A/B family lipoprotein [Limnobaculum]MBK5145693.1 entericidin A/B family lipoprotein [Limnobaculum allomyrinae]MBV7693773.1 entericidin A/B family lipoprotein [Limnobaculum sp. M2-1]
MFKAISAIFLSLVVVSALSGCNTVRGFGEDIRHVGSAIERGAS